MRTPIFSSSNKPKQNPRSSPNAVFYKLRFYLLRKQARDSNKAMRLKQRARCDPERRAVCAAKDLNHSIVQDQISEELQQQHFRTRQPSTAQ
jgi:hypothetical protein